MSMKNEFRQTGMFELEKKVADRLRGLCEELEVNASDAIDHLMNIEQAYQSDENNRYHYKTVCVTSITLFEESINALATEGWYVKNSGVYLIRSTNWYYALMERAGVAPPTYGQRRPNKEQPINSQGE